MRLLVPAVLLAVPAIALAATPTTEKRECRSANADMATRLVAPPPKAQRLDRLPPGNLELTVVREIDGCREPVIVRYGVGATANEPPRRR